MDIDTLTFCQPGLTTHWLVMSRGDLAASDFGCEWDFQMLDAFLSDLEDLGVNELSMGE